MAYRIASNDVTAILSTSLTTLQIEAFIGDVELWISEELATLGSISAARLALIEKYLVCAFIRVRDLGLKSASMNDVTEQYQVDPTVSDYLLRAAALDPTGTIRSQFMPQTERRPAKFLVGTTFTQDRENLAGDEA